MTTISSSLKLTPVDARRAPAPGMTGLRKTPTGTRRKTSAQSRSAAPRLGLALAGGGPLGVIYELGALCALEEAIAGLDCSRLDVYVGVSAGAVITACLANRLSTAQLVDLLIGQPNQAPALNPNLFLQPAYQEYWQRLRSLPGLLLKAAWDWLQQPWSFGWLNPFTGLGQAVPTGAFDNKAIASYLEHLFTQDQRTNTFPALPRTLYIVAVELDTGQPAVFGSPPLAHIPIAKAVQASAALPGLYPPVAIDGRYYVDGALSKTLHASVALENELDLLLCLNPLVPFDAQQAAQAGHAYAGTLVRGGLPVVLSQTFRTLIRSRMQVGMAGYARRYPNTDLLLFEPNSDDPQVFFANPFSFADRREVYTHAYQATLRDLWTRRETLAPILARQGLRLQVERLATSKPPARMDVAARVAPNSPVTALVTAG
ncbi:MAG: patatin-like phospholipase family protein [Candidatus Competibacteraceae bacterium]